MNKAIEQKILFTGATAEELFDIFVNPQKHSAIHGGATTKISGKEGDSFSLLNGNLNGKNLLIVPHRMIVQSWRGNIWKKDDLDSILILVFANKTNGAEIKNGSCLHPKSVYAVVERNLLATHKTIYQPREAITAC